MVLYDQSGNEIETRYFGQEVGSPIEYDLSTGENQLRKFEAISLNPVPSDAAKCKIILDLKSSDGTIVHSAEKEVQVRKPVAKNTKPVPEGTSNVSFDEVPVTLDFESNQSTGTAIAYQYDGPMDVSNSLLAKKQSSINGLVQLNKYWELVTDLIPGSYKVRVSITYNPETDFPTDYEINEDSLVLAVWDTLSQQLIILSSDLDTQNNTLSADVDFLGTSYVIGIPTTITDVPERKEILPTDYFLKQNYPNPFNPSTKISFEIPEYCVVHLTVYNILGKEIAVITEGEFSPGCTHNHQAEGIIIRLRN